MNSTKPAPRKCLIAVLVYSTFFLIDSALFAGQSAADHPFVSIDSTIRDYERRCLIKVGKMEGSRELTDLQIQRVKYLFEEQRSMIDLFKNHSLLGGDRLQAKLESVLEVTKFEIESIFTSNQLATWYDWDRRLDAKIRPRQRILPAP